MLKSKYLTEQGLEFFLKGLYRQGYRYLFYNPVIHIYIASEQEPYFKDDKFMSCYGDKKMVVVSSLEVAIVQELLEDYLYIKIDKHIDVYDWENVPVDTLIKVRKADYEWIYRYFAKYEDGLIFTFANGATSVTAVNKDAVVGYKVAKLVE